MSRMYFTVQASVGVGENLGAPHRRARRRVAPTGPHDAGAIGAAVASAKRRRSADEARRVGVRVVRRVGEPVRSGDAVLRFMDVEPDQETLRLLKQAVDVGKTRAAGRPLLLEAIANVR